MSYSEVLVILEILEIIPPEENFFLVLFKLLTEAEIEGGFYWLETNGLSKKIKHKNSIEGCVGLQQENFYHPLFQTIFGQHFVKGT